MRRLPYEIRAFCCAGSFHSTAVMRWSLSIPTLVVKLVALLDRQGAHLARPHFLQLLLLGLQVLQVKAHELFRALDASFITRRPAVRGGGRLVQEVASSNLVDINEPLDGQRVQWLVKQVISLIDLIALTDKQQATVAWLQDRHLRRQTFGLQHIGHA